MNAKKTVKNYKCLSMFKYKQRTRDTASKSNCGAKVQCNNTQLVCTRPWVQSPALQRKEKEVKMIIFQNIHEQGGTWPQPSTEGQKYGNHFNSKDRGQHQQNSETLTQILKNAQNVGKKIIYIYRVFYWAVFCFPFCLLICFSLFKLYQHVKLPFQHIMMNQKFVFLYKAKSIVDTHTK